MADNRSMPHAGFPLRLTATPLCHQAFASKTDRLLQSSGEVAGLTRTDGWRRSKPRIWEDRGDQWARPVENTGRGGNPASLSRLADERLALVYGSRMSPFGIKMKLETMADSDGPTRISSIGKHRFPIWAIHERSS